MLILWRVCFVLDFLPFTSRQMLLVLSCWNTNGCAPNFLMIELVGMVSTCCLIDNFTHMTKFIASFIPIILTTIKLVEFTFCLFDRENIAPFPNVNIALVWLCMLLCRANEASILHNNVPDSFHLMTSSRWTVVRRYIITLVVNFYCWFLDSGAQIRNSNLDIRCRSFRDKQQSGRHAMKELSFGGT